MDYGFEAAGFDTRVVNEIDPICCQTLRDNREWPVIERSERILFAMGTGFVGALVPYALPPRPWRAYKELQRLRAVATGSGASLSYVVRF